MTCFQNLDDIINQLVSQLKIFLRSTCTKQDTWIERKFCLQYLGGECDLKKLLVISTQADLETHCQAHADGLRACSNGSLIYSYINVSLQINIACVWCDDPKVKESIFTYMCAWKSGLYYHFINVICYSSVLIISLHLVFC